MSNTNHAVKCQSCGVFNTSETPDTGDFLCGDCFDSPSKALLQTNKELIEALKAEESYILSQLKINLVPSYVEILKIVQAAIHNAEGG